MLSIQLCSLPDGALLARYAGGPHFTDCYTTQLDRAIGLPAFVQAFYTTRLFRLERMIIGWAVGRPSTDAQALSLAEGRSNEFSAWSAEARDETQLLLKDMRGATRSWLMVAPLNEPGGMGTRLYFGSAVIAVENPSTGRPELGWGFRSLLGFHRVYSRALLSSARRRLAINRVAGEQA